MKNNDLGYFIYSRKSSEDSQRQIASIEDQKNALKKTVDNESLEIVDILSEERSAKDPGRPIFNDMLNRIEKKEADAILCWDIDRLSRNPIDNGRLQWMLQKGVIKVIKTPSRSFYPEDAGLLMSIEGGRATDFVMRLSKNVKRGLNGKALKGWRPSGGPIGYLNAGTEKGNKTIVSDPERFLLVRKMWDLFLTGTYPVSKILDIANNKWGLRTLQHRKIGGKPLSLNHLYRIFNDTFYYGYFPWIDPETNEQRLYKGSHEPMITEAEYWRVQTLLGNKGKQRERNRRFAFTGLMKCGECGCGITAEEKNQIICTICKHKFAYENKECCPKCQIKIEKMKNPTMLHYTYYHCVKKRGPCSQKSILLNVLEDQFKEELKKITIDQDYLDIALDYLRSKQDNFGKEESARRHLLEKEYDNCQARLKNLNNEYMSPHNVSHAMYSPGEFVILKNQIILERTKIEDELKNVREKLDNSIEASIKTFNFCAFALHHFNTDDINKKRIIFSTIGSNLILKDKKLIIDKLHPFLLIENEMIAQRNLQKRLEPKNNLDTYSSKDVFTHDINALLPG